MVDSEDLPKAEDYRGYLYGETPAAEHYREWMKTTRIRIAAFLERKREPLNRGESVMMMCADLYVEHEWRRMWNRHSDDVLGKLKTNGWSIVTVMQGFDGIEGVIISSRPE